MHNTHNNIRMACVNIGMPDTAIILVRTPVWTCCVLTQLPNESSAAEDFNRTL